MPKNVFGSVVGNHPGLNHFDLSYTNTLSMKMGLLYITQCDMVTPGDYWKMKSFVHAELMPLVAPVMSDILMYVHTFFVPFRLLYGVDVSDGQPIWEKFITGGQDGDYDTPLTPWTPSFSKTTFSSETIWDSVGNPVVKDPDTGVWTPKVPYGLDVMAAPKLAYNFIWNNYYRSEDYNDEVDLWTNEDLLFVNFKKDYFTSAAWAQQRGTAPALPVDVRFDFGNSNYPIGMIPETPVTISGAPNFYYRTSEHNIGHPNLTPLNTNFGLYPYGTHSGEVVRNSDTLGIFTGGSSSVAELNTAVGSLMTSADSGSLSGSIPVTNVYGKYGTDNYAYYWNNAVKATTFTVSDLRLAFAIQRLQELSMVGGYRYTEYLHSHYGVSPTDARLDRPEYIGGFVTNVTVSPVVQTSSTTGEPSDLGTKGANGRIDTVNSIGNYRVLEHGLIMTLCNIIPKPIYSQGINRQWLYQDRFQYYIPELANLSETGIWNAQLYVDGIDPTQITPEVGQKFDNDIFGYQAAWNEMRCKDSIVTGAVRETFDYWTLARKFNSRPALNADFLKVVHSDFNRIFAVQDEDPFIVSFSNLIDAYRPIPAFGTPGLIDHVYGGR